MKNPKKGDLFQCVPFANSGNTLMLCTHARARVFTRVTIDKTHVYVERDIVWPGAPEKAWTLIGNALSDWGDSGKCRPQKGQSDE